MLTGAFKVVPTGMHTLSVYSSPSGLMFTLNGEKHVTPYSELLNVNRIYIISMPKAYRVDNYGLAPLWKFWKWEDESASSTRIINLQNHMSVVAIYDLGHY